MRKKNVGVDAEKCSENAVYSVFDRDIRWEKLDNTAHLFPVIASEQMSNVFRVGVTLNELVVPALLQKALDIVLPKFDDFNLRLRYGFFWHYFEENGKEAPRIEEEKSFPCRM